MPYFAGLRAMPFFRASEPAGSKRHPSVAIRALLRYPCVVKAISVETFRDWLHTNSIKLGESFVAHQHLSFPDSEHRAIWTLPKSIEDYGRFIEATLDSIEPWSGVYLWPADGKWPKPPPDNASPLTTRGKLMRCMQETSGWDGALYCTASQRDLVLGIVFAHLLDGNAPGDDLYVATDSGSEILYVDYEQALHVSCRSERRLITVVGALESRGFHLPTELSAIFKLPPFMAARYS